MPPYGCLARVRLASRGLSRQRQRLPYQMGGSERHERTRDTQRAPTRSHHLSPTRAHHRLCDSPASQQQQQQHGASCTNGGAARRRATSSLVTWARCGRAARPGKLRGRRRRQSRRRARASSTPSRRGSSAAARSPTPAGTAVAMDDLGGGHEKVLHQVERDERPRAAEAGLAVNCERAGFGLGDLEEALEDLLRWVATVRKVQVVVVEVCICELLAIINLVVEAHDASDVVLAKVLEVGLGRVGLHAVDVGDRGLRWARERQELARHDPVEVAVLDALVVLVLVGIKRLVIVPPQGDALVEACEAVQHGERVARRSQLGTSDGFTF
eukprot:CAMPEP_0115846842 /NCGR_PEP_ID=MMETSP0287-20121206/10070_1 /TAXON_ID=412157 /ORGANISM="Chrysochromulina rotalis, Strain UIO044" /LENGTH=326 /DNA_ID=CAMNT_0003300647 /DNA_START=998 /DNA_END=1979 /DNA_ORIENTATION=-